MSCELPRRRKMTDKRNSLVIPPGLCTRHICICTELERLEFKINYSSDEFTNREMIMSSIRGMMECKYCDRISKRKILHYSITTKKSCFTTSQRAYMAFNYKP